MKKDLSKDLTVFLISSGKHPSYPLARSALENQTVNVKIDEIKDVAPMSKAFQEMLNRCETPYYIECDEDMELKEDSCEKMYDVIKKSDNKTSMVGFQLHDTHLDFIIYGVKIYKYDIFKNYPYDLEHLSCEMEQLERMKKDGYGYILIQDVVGEHSPQWSNELIFQRYLNLMEKYKEFKYSWLEDVPHKLFKILQAKPTEKNLYALLGAYSSIISEKPIQVGEKDFRNYRVKECEKMRSYIEPPDQATLYVTNKCNFKCRYCMRQHTEMEKFPDMSSKVVDNLLDKFPSIKNVCICGFGEPLMCSTLEDVMKTLKKRKVNMSLITNGSLIKDNWKLIQKYKPMYMSVSVNAYDADHHREEVGVSDWDRVIEGIKLVKDSDIDLYVSHICTKDNWKNVPKFLSYMKSLGIDSVHLHNLAPHFDEMSNKNFWDLVLTDEDQLMFDLVQNLPDADIVKNWPILIKKGDIRRDCIFPWKSIGVNGNGYISVCNSVAYPQKQNGHLSDENLWHNDYCEDLRKSVLGEQKEMCKKCFRNWNNGF